MLAMKTFHTNQDAGCQNPSRSPAERTEMTETERFKKRVAANAANRRYGQKKYHSDPEYRRPRYEASYAWRKKKLTEDPALREKYRQYSRTYLAKKKEREYEAAFNPINRSWCNCNIQRY